MEGGKEREREGGREEGRKSKRKKEGREKGGKGEGRKERKTRKDGERKTERGEGERRGRKRKEKTREFQAYWKHLTSGEKYCKLIQVVFLKKEEAASWFSPKDQIYLSRRYKPGDTHFEKQTMGAAKPWELLKAP